MPVRSDVWSSARTVVLTCVRSCHLLTLQNCFEVLREKNSVGADGDAMVKGAKTNRKGQIVQGKR